MKQPLAVRRDEAALPISEFGKENCMIERRKANKHEAGWSTETVALAHAARRELFDALHSLKAANVKAGDADRYERLFAQAEALLDGTQPHKLLATAQEYLFRTSESWDSPQSARSVAHTYAHGLLVAMFHRWKLQKE
jgi:hypothetical protein